MEEMIQRAFEIKIRQHSEYIKDWIRGHCDIELEPALENEVIRVIDDSTSMFICELKGE